MTGAVARKGSPDAGALIIIVRLANDVLKIYGPAPGPAHDDLGRRRWLALFDARTLSQSEADAFVARQASIDPDIWVIDIDDAAGTGLLDEAAIE